MVEAKSELEKIKEDYESKLKEIDFENEANYLFKKFSKIENVHALNYRIKDPDHLIEKIKRKQKDNPKRIITVENYNKEITDLIGFRILHVFKDGWKTIDDYIRKYFKDDFIDDPIFCYREGDNIGDIDETKFKKECRKSGYRSIHYVIKKETSGFEIPVEIQVRTIFEDAWGEIDHTIRYPNYIDDSLINDYSAILNRLAGLGDEIGINIRNIKEALANSQNQADELIKKLKLTQDQRDILAVDNFMKSSKPGAVAGGFAGGLLTSYLIYMLLNKNKDES